MQLIKFGETIAARCEIPFDSIQSADHVSMLLGSTLANAGITVKIKRAGVGAAVSGTGAFTTVDDTNAGGVRGYVPSVGDQVLGVNTFIFTGTGMDPAHVPVCFVPWDPFDVVRLGLTALRPDARQIGTVTAGTLTANAFSTNLTIPAGQLAAEAHWRFLGNVTAALAGQVQKIATYSGGVLGFTNAFSVAPAIGDQGVLVDE